jgi:solute:Na+ symporter, SSS family
MFGLFFLAMFVPFATPFGAVVGAVCSFASAVVVGYWDMLTGQPGISFQWIAPVSLAVSIGVGCALSLFPTRGKPWPVLAGYTAATLAPIAVLFVWLRT